MKILRQKVFTRAEREALRQIYRKTGGLRNLPNGVTSLEDAKALKKIGYSVKQRSNFSRNNARNTDSPQQHGIY